VLLRPIVELQSPDPKETQMPTFSGRRTGLLVLGLVSLGDVATIFVTDGDTPPYAVAALALVLGLASLWLVVSALRDPHRPLRLLIGLRVLSAVTAVPAFFAAGVPAPARMAAAAVVCLTAVGVLLAAQSLRTPAVA
jgi:peptidoglycan/LPS O-acetylase OafA/YrhL